MDDLDFNAPRWPKAGRGGFNEAWYVVASEPRSGFGLWLRATVSVGQRGAEQFALWGSWFERDRPDRSFALMNPSSAAAISRSISELSAGECTGEVEGGGHSLRWRFSFGHGAPGVDFIPRWLRPVSRLRGTGIVFPNLAATITGAVEVDGRLIELTRVPAGQAHQWQRTHLAGWAWGHCSTFAEDPDASLDLLDAIGPGGIRVPLFMFRFRGEVHHFGDLPWIALARSRPASPSWHFSARNARLSIDGVAHVTPSQMVQVQYPEPDGSALYCVNSEIASMELHVRSRAVPVAAFRPEITLTSRSGACLEFCGRAPDARVENLLIVAAARQKQAQPAGSVAS